MMRYLIAAATTAGLVALAPFAPALAGDDRYEYEYEYEYEDEDEDDYFEDRRHRRHMAHVGPPDWAPAHGHRHKHRHKHKHKHRHRHHHHGDRYDTRDYAPYPNQYAYNPLSDIGVGRCNRDAIGALLGGAAGGLLGSQIGDGTGQMAAVGAGVLLGAIFGSSVGRQMDQIDQSCVGQVLEYAPDNQAVTWQNPNTDAYYTTTATNTYEQSNGRYCREYQTTATVGGRVQNMYGTACRQPDGAWEIVN